MMDAIGVGGDGIGSFGLIRGQFKHLFVTPPAILDQVEDPSSSIIYDRLMIIYDRLIIIYDRSIIIYDQS